MTENPNIGKFAVDESGNLGYIMEVRQVGEQVVYTGIPVKDDSIWISVNPKVIEGEIDPSSLLEIVMQIAPPSSIKKMGPSGSVSADSIKDPVAKWDTFFTVQPGLDMKEVFESFFNNPIGGQKPNMMKPPEAGDFQIDSNPSDEDDDD